MGSSERRSQRGGGVPSIGCSMLSVGCWMFCLVAFQLPRVLPRAHILRVSYTVFARKYRPQTFDDVVGQDHITRTLRNAIEHHRLAHAYIFVGPRGTGKTSTARILAKALNCEKGPTTTPCDQCDMCRAIMSGEDTDVLEIDGASNRGIDEVREIRSHVQYRPSRAR